MPAEFTWDEVSALIAGTGVAHIATTSTDGGAHVAQVFAAVEGTRLTFTTRTTSAKAANIRANTRVAMTWQGNSAETYVWGNASLSEAPAVKRHVWESGIVPFDLSHFYGAVDSSGWCVVSVVPVRAVAMMQTSEGLVRRAWRP
ncbi:MAG: Pyridoxamine 5-phosphate oxidase [Actinomycetota bacterium]